MQVAHVARILRYLYFEPKRFLNVLFHVNGADMPEQDMQELFGFQQVVKCMCDLYLMHIFPAPIIIMGPEHK